MKEKLNKNECKQIHRNEQIQNTTHINEFQLTHECVNLFVCMYVHMLLNI